MKRVRKHDDGTYHINGSKFDELVGSRAQVWHGTAYKTAGGLTKKNLLKNKHGRIVSKSKHTTARREKRLEKHGYKTKKGQFGSFKTNATLRKKNRKRRTNRKRR
jgi:hypothetical protein